MGRTRCGWVCPLSRDFRAYDKMRVYIPFPDGSAVSFDGERFTLHRRPVEIDAVLGAFAENSASEAWARRRDDLVRVLESAWIRRREQAWMNRIKRVYSRELTDRVGSRKSRLGARDERSHVEREISYMRSGRSSNPGEREKE